MRIIRTLLAAVVALAVVSAAAFYVYLLRHEMAPAAASEVGAPGEHPAVLVATQGSEYKDAVTRELTDHLRGRAAYMRIIDVSQLPSVVEREWDAIVLMHTWEKWEPEPHALAFIERAREPHKLVVLSTSGAGDERVPGVDAVTSASEVDRAGRDAGEVGRRVDAVLAARGPRPAG